MNALYFCTICNTWVCSDTLNHTCDSLYPYILETTDTSAVILPPTPATKHDQGKADLTLIRLDAITPIAEVFMFGAKKYGRGNYLTGMSHTRLLAAAGRHLFAYIGGENLDPESGKSHLAHLGCCILMMLTYQAHNLGTDDRDPNLTDQKK